MKTRFLPSFLIFYPQSLFYLFPLLPLSLNQIHSESNTTLNRNTTMVAIKDVRASNAAFKASRPSVVAVFVGATSGIGLSTLEKLAAASDATLYVLGRSKASATPLLDNLAKINPEARVNFIETEIGLIKNVDKACEEIAAKEKKIDILFMSPGGVTLNGRVGRCCHREQKSQVCS
jgi:hypothetical protein